MDIVMEGAEPLVLRYRMDGVTLRVRIEPDRDAKPWWLGRIVPKPTDGAQRMGSEWLVPDVPESQQMAQLTPYHGRRKARLLVHDRLQDDYRRLKAYGRTWTLYRMTVEALAADQRPLAVDVYEGVGVESLPLTGNLGLVLSMASRFGQKEKEAVAEAEDSRPVLRELRDGSQQWRPTKTQSVSFWCSTCKCQRMRSRTDGRCPFCGFGI